MTVTEAGLLLVGSGLVGLAVVVYSHSKNFTYLEGLHMAGKAAVMTAISGLMLAIANEKTELVEARAEEKARQEELIAAAREGQDLTDVVAALNEATAQVQGIIERPAPQVDIPELTELETPAPYRQHDPSLGEPQPGAQVGEATESAPVEGEGLGAGEVVAEPVVENDEVVGGIVHDETEVKTSPTGETETEHHPV